MSQGTLIKINKTVEGGNRSLQQLLCLIPKKEETHAQQQGGVVSLEGFL